MSIHSSLRVGNNLAGERSVFTRVERLAILKKAGKFSDETGVVHGIPKVRTRYKIAGVKKVKEAAAPAAGSTVAAGKAVAGKAAAPAAKGAAPAAAAKAAPAKKK